MKNSASRSPVIEGVIFHKRDSMSPRRDFKRTSRYDSCPEISKSPPRAPGVLRSSFRMRKPSPVRQELLTGSPVGTRRMFNQRDKSPSPGRNLYYQREPSGNAARSNKNQSSFHPDGQRMIRSYHRSNSENILKHNNTSVNPRPWQNEIPLSRRHQPQREVSNMNDYYQDHPTRTQLLNIEHGPENDRDPYRSLNNRKKVTVITPQQQIPMTSKNNVPSSPYMQRSQGTSIPESPNLPRSNRGENASDYYSNREYLTKMREILLGEPIKGNIQHPAQLLPYLYIGSQTNAESLKVLRKLGITHVLNMAGYKGPKRYSIDNPYEEVDIEYLEIKAEDNDLYNIVKHFDEAFSFLDRVKRAHGICLLHCAMGINRSGSTCVGYLMVQCNWPLLKAVEYIKKKRGVVLTNHGFQRQLIQYARDQGLLDALTPRVVLTDAPHEERNFIKSLHNAKYGHWTEALSDLKIHAKEYKEIPVTKDHNITLESSPGSALMYRYQRFMNRDKV